MGQILEQTRAELKSLPLILGKLAGGLTTVAGFGAAAVHAGTVGETSYAPLGYLFMGFAGILIFVLAERRLKIRLAATPVKTSPWMHLLSWVVFLVLAGLFLFGVYWFAP